MNIIRVTLPYDMECLIPAGEYRADDPVLHGKAAILLSAGHARIIGQAEDAPPEVSAIVDKTPAPPKAPTRRRRK